MYNFADGSFAALLIIHFLAAVKPATSLQARHNDRKLSINPSSGGSPVAAAAYKQGFLQLRPIYPILLLAAQRRPGLPRAAGHGAFCRWWSYLAAGYYP